MAARRTRLDLEPDELRRLGHAVVELMAEALAAEREDPVLPAARAPEVTAAIDEPVPWTGTGCDDVLERLRTSFLPYVRKNGSPRFFGYVQASVDPFGALVDGLCSLVNQNVTAWRSAPGAATMERLVVRWLGEALGFASDAQGLLTSGGSAANAIGIACALRRAAERAGESTGDALGWLRVYATREAHLSLRKSLRALGIADEQQRVIAIDAERRMRPAKLERALAADRQAGALSAVVFASAGTANTGAIDPLHRIADLCRDYDVWLHVDGAYGAPAALTDDYAFLRAELARADSLSIDPHKWMFAPLDVGCFLCRDERDLLGTFGSSSEYVAVEETDPDERFAFFERGPELSRRARALKVWAILRARGFDALAAIIAENCRLRAHLDRRVALEPRLEALGSGLSIACFRYRPEGDATPAAIDRVNQRILTELVRSGRFVLSPTTLDGRYALRVCICNHRTTAADVDELVEQVLALGPRVGS